MSTRKLLLSAFDGYAEYAEFDDLDPKKMVVKTLQDMEPILERAKALSELEPGKNFRHCAIIPKQVLDKSMREGWFNDKKRWKRWVNDADNRAFRTWPGQL